MRAYGVNRGVAVAAPMLVLAASASAVNIDLSANAVTNVSDVTGGLVALDLTGIVTGLTASNSLASNFSTPGFNGSVTASVFANQSTPGSGLNALTIVYEFVGNGVTPIDAFEFGLNTGSDLDFGDYNRATLGAIGELTTAGQGNPVVTLTDNSLVAGNNSLLFDFNAGGDTLGVETFGWYIQIDGDVVVNRALVEVRDFGGDVFEMLALVTGTGQPDLSVPAPGALALFAGAGLVGARRRRR